MSNTFCAVMRLKTDPEPREKCIRWRGFVESWGKNKEGRKNGFFIETQTFNKKVGEILARYAKKGGRIYVSGELRENSWEKDGQPKKMFVLVAHTVSIIDFAEAPASSLSNDAPKAEFAASSPEAAQVMPEEKQEDIPF